MRRFCAIGLLSLGACAGKAATPTPAAAPPGPPPPAVGDLGVQLDKLPALTGFVESIGSGWGEAFGFSGFVLVAQHDRPIYAQAFGFADREQKRPPSADTSFRVGSITKQFTAAAILRLEQAGKLSVTDRVGKHLPDYPGPGKDVTIHQLLTHTGGIPSYTSDATVVARKADKWTVSNLLASFWNKPLQFAPGSDHVYSNSGYAVLGAIIERASGQDYATYLKEQLFTPAGMSRTLVGDAEGDSDRALGYHTVGSSLMPADVIDMSLPFAAGGIRSTARDLVRWHRALAGDAILAPASRAKLYTPALGNYAYGWVVEELFGRRVLWHAGGIDGFQADYWRIPDADLAVVVLSNAEEAPTQAVAKAAIAAAFGQVLQPPPQPRRIDLDQKVVARLIGSYRLTPESRKALVERQAPPQLIASILTVAITGGSDTIEMKPNGQDPVKLAPTGLAEFFDPASKIFASFDLAGRGPAGRLTIEQGPLKIIYRRTGPLGGKTAP